MNLAPPLEVMRPELALTAYLQVEPVGRSKLAGSPVAFLSLDRFLRTLERFPGLQSLHFQGASDPLLHPRFFDMVSAAVARGASVSAASPLSGLGPARAEECLKSGLRRLDVLLDPASRAYALGLRNLGRLEDAKRRLGVVLPQLVPVRKPVPAPGSGMAVSFQGLLSPL